MWRFALTVLLLIAGSALWIGSYRPRILEAPVGVSIVPLRTITTIEARLLLLLTGVDGVPVERAVDLYRVNYSARAGNGKLMHLSGLLALPHDGPFKRIVSFQHGTSTTRSAVPSKPDGTGIAVAIAFAGNGFVLVAPDYPGLGVSDWRHPYYVADAIAPAVAGMIETVQRLKGVPSAPAFLAGFSQGGWASLAALRFMEEHGAMVLGSAQVAGAYDLRNISLPETMRGKARSGSLYLAYATWGHAAYYERPLDSVLTSHYATLTNRLFEGATPEEIIDALPRDPRQLFNESFLSAFDTGGSHWFLESFAQNSLVTVTPKAPVRLYFGSKDADVSPRESIELARGMTEAGSDAVVVDLGPLEHEPSMITAAPLILSWLFELDRAGSQTQRAASPEAQVR